MGTKPPPLFGPVNSIDFRGFLQAPTGARPHWKEKKIRPPLNKFLNNPLFMVESHVQSTLVWHEGLGSKGIKFSPQILIF